MPSFHPCSCCKSDPPEHAIQSWRDAASGDTFKVRVPWEHRHNAIGWSRRVRWKGPDGAPMVGAFEAEGESGIVALTEDGKEHRLHHGTYEDLDETGGGVRRFPRLALRRAAPAAVQPLIKAMPLKPGQRWITVHPHGPGTEGQAVLIEPAGDGTHRVIAGAGGALTHLRLRNVGDGTPKEGKKKGPRNDSDEAKVARSELERRKREAERAFVEKVRTRHGGIAADLDDAKLADLSEGARNLLKTRHHAKQVREARAVVGEFARKLAEQDASAAKAGADLSVALDDQPALVQQAREAAALELDLVEQEAQERRGERAARSARVTSGETRVGERAAENVAEAIRAAPDPQQVIAAIEQSPSASAADLKEMEAHRSLAKAKAALDEGDAEEAAAAFRRHEVQTAQAEAYRAIEEEAGPEAALNALAYSRILTGIAQEAGTAARLGLTDTEHVPVRGSELGDMLETLQDAEKLRKVRREFRTAVRAVENGDYDRSRRAFEIDASDEVSEAAQRSVRDEATRQLTELLIGVADPKRPAHVQAVAAGHYDALADVALGLADQRFVDRPTVDALGLRNSAFLLRHALEAQGYDTKAMGEAVTTHHVASLERITTEALARADRAVPHLSTVVSDVGSLEGALAHIQAAEADLDEAQRAVGSALGRMEFTATMGQALRERLPDALKVQTGDSPDGTLQWLHSVGLAPGDYKLSADRKSVTIPKPAWGKLVRPVPRAELERRSAVRAIKRGDSDEPGWLPAGIKRREASTFTAPPPDAPRFFEPLRTSGDLRANLENHVGRRVAEGEHPAEIMRDMLSPQVLDSVPNRDQFIQHVRDVFPLVGEDGKAKKYEESAGHFEALAEKAVGDRAYHAQDIRPDDEKTREAVFRSLAAHPRARVAFKPVGDLTPQEQNVLRDHFYERMGIDPKVRIDEARYRAELADLGPEPSKTAGTMSLFGDSGPTAEWKEWKRDRDAILARNPRAGLADALADLGTPPPDGTPARAEYEARADALREAATKAPTAWGRYVLAHGTLEAAQAAMQDEIRSGFVKEFAAQYGKVTGRPIRTGITEIRNAERHVAAVATPEEREELIRQAQRTYAALRARAGGKFAAEGEGAVIGKFTEWLEQSTIAEQNQGGLFASTPQMRHTRGDAAPKTGQRYSVGRRAEEQIGSLVAGLGHGFGKDRVDLVKGLGMDGDQIHQQRVIKMLRQNGGRLGAYLGTGSGKSLTSIGAFTDAHARGEAQHGLYLVPAAVQQQFGAEVLRFTEPGKYRWATGEGKGHEERVAMLKDPDVHMRVLTHEAFRDTALKVMADHHQRTPEQMEADLRKSDPKTRARWMREAFDANGIPRHFVYGDEWHRVTTREGEPSALHLVGSAVAHPSNASHFLAGTATPHKNDASEVYSMAAMLDPDKYADRHEFMQSFGHDLEHNPNAIRRELDHLTYSAHIKPAGVDRVDNDQEVKLTGEHARHVERVGELYDQASKALRRGVVDVAAVRELSPKAFEGHPEAEHEAIAARLGKSLGIVRESAMRRAVNGAPAEFNQKLRAVGDHVERDLAATWTDRSGKEQRGKPSIVFTDRLSEARMLHEHLRSRGIRAALYHGGLGTSEREAVRKGFQPPAGADPAHDVIVATSAAEAGINLQRARVVHHYDVPETEKSHTQRSGRAYRQGAQGDVEIHNWHTDTEYERAGRARLARKAALGEVFRSNLSTVDERGVADAYAAAIARRHQAQEVA